MLEWTGERFLPRVEGAQINYEHLHRYAFAAELVKDKKVLDLACGEGYGPYMLSREAESVIGVDKDGHKKSRRIPHFPSFRASISRKEENILSVKRDNIIKTYTKTLFNRFRACCTNPPSLQMISGGKWVVK